MTEHDDIRIYKKWTKLTVWNIAGKKEVQREKTQVSNFNNFGLEKNAFHIFHTDNQ